MTSLSTLFPAGSSGGSGMIIGDRIAYTSGKTATVATESGWVPPSGYELWGWRVICIGAGGGGGTSNGGNGGYRAEETVHKSLFGSTITITVPSGGAANTSGGEASFGGIVRAPGGEANARVAGTQNDVFFNNLSSNPTFIVVGEGLGGTNVSQLTVHGSSSASGKRGGGGGGRIVHYPDYYNPVTPLGGAVYPSPRVRGGLFSENGSGVTEGLHGDDNYSYDSSNSKRGFILRKMHQGLGNPTLTYGAAGHSGIGDYPGGGGNGGGTYYDTNDNPVYINGGTGGFPGGGGGAGNTGGVGGAGVVIAYPIFRKT